MNYVLSFDRATILLISVLLWIYIVRPKFNNLSSKIYQLLMLFVLLASVFEIFVCIIIESPMNFPMGVNKLFFVLFYYSINITPILYYRYAIEMTTIGKVKKSELIVYWSALIVDLCLVALIPVSDLMIYFDENNKFMHGPLFIGLYIVSLTVLIIAGVRFYRHRSMLNRIQRFAVLFFYFINIGAIIFERFMPNVNILTFVTALFMFLLYVSMQNPEYYVDAEIGCYNEEAFLEVCKDKLNNSKRFTIISFYSDSYEYITQTFGVEQGTALARYVSNYFVENYKFQNLFHISDCNFVYIASHKLTHIEEVYKKIWNDFDQDYEVNNVKISLQARGAAIVVPNVVDTPEDILDAVNFSKNKNLLNKSDELCFIDPDFLGEKRRKERIAQIIKEQINAKGFELRYLPILDVKRDRVVAAEALVRLYDEKLGEVKPSEFIEIAEEYGLVYDIDKAIFDKVCKCLHRLELQRYDIKKMQINLSTLEIMQGDSVEYWLKKMRSMSIDSSKLNFEIREEVCKDFNTYLVSNMERLKEKGCTFSIDNYGTGFSNIIDLLNMNFQMINIDRSILWEAMKSEEAMHILENMISMFKELDYEVLITGVENREQFETVKRLGVDYIKGYIISRPVDEDDFAKMLSTPD